MKDTARRADHQRKLRGPVRAGFAMNEKRNVTNIQEIDIQVYTVAVGTGPVLWAVYCEICDENLNEGTQDEALVGRLEAEHQAFHLGLSLTEYRSWKRSENRKL